MIPSALRGNRAGTTELVAEIKAALEAEYPTVIVLQDGASKALAERALARMAPGCTHVTFEVRP